MKRGALGLLVVGLVALTGALAEAARPARPETKPAARGAAQGRGAAAKASAEPKVEPSASAAPPATASADDLGAPPPSATVTGAAPSPLTPLPPELPSASALPPLRELDRLLGDVNALRGRVAQLGQSLFTARLRVKVRASGAEELRLAAFEVALDGGALFTAPAGWAAREERTVLDRPIAPGKHRLTVRATRVDGRGPGWSSEQLTTLTLGAPNKRIVELRVELVDDSDMSRFDRDGAGDYRMELRARATVVEQ